MEFPLGESILIKNYVNLLNLILNSFIILPNYIYFLPLWLSSLCLQIWSNQIYFGSLHCTYFVFIWYIILIFKFWASCSIYGLHC